MPAFENRNGHVVPLPLHLRCNGGSTNNGGSTSNGGTGTVTPGGIKFSYLPDFRDELMDIYKQVKGPFFNLCVAKKSIEDVTDPLNNSINEKCSRIRAAFVSKFDEHLAKFYYIDGKWGDVKKIQLPRHLVKWE